MEGLSSGPRVVVEIVAHHVWGMEVVTAEGKFDGVIDIIHVSNIRTLNSFDDYPPIGSQIGAEVLGYTPSGQLRLSMTDSDF